MVMIGDFRTAASTPERGTSGPPAYPETQRRTPIETMIPMSRTNRNQRALLSIKFFVGVMAYGA